MTRPPSFTLKRNPISAWVYRASWEFRNRGRNRRFLFVATTGRSGTGFLQEAFATADGCASFHEAWPIMNGPVLRAANQGKNEAARRTYWVQKAVNIRRSMADQPLYVETNHQFIKSFAEYAIQDFGSRLLIVHLRRGATAVARSILELGAAPGTEFGNDWYLDFRAPGNLLDLRDLLEDEGELHHGFFRCLWYWYEIEARVQDLRARTRHLDWIQLDWDGRIELSQIAGVIRQAGLEPDPDLLEPLCARKVNQQVDLKDRGAPSQDRLDAMHQRFRDLLAQRGYLDRFQDGN